MFTFSIFFKRHQTKEKFNKCDYIKLKSSCTENKTINVIKRQPTEWEKILANHNLDKELITTIYKELIKLNSKTTT